MLNNVSLPTPQQTNFPASGKNGNPAAGADNSVKAETSQTSNAVQAGEKTGKGAASEFTKKLKGNEAKAARHSRTAETARNDRTAKASKKARADKTAKASDKGGVTSAASEFTNALRKLESKGKINLANQDVDALAKRLADSFSGRGINARKLAKFMSRMLSSTSSDSFANNISNDADKTGDNGKTNDAAASRNIVGGIASDSLASGIDSKSLRVMRQSANSDSGTTSVRERAEADAKAAAKAEAKPDTATKADTTSVRERAEADAKAVATAKAAANGNGNSGTGNVNGNGNGEKPENAEKAENGNAQNLVGNNNFDEVFELAMSLFSAANERIGENANAVLGAQNRGGLSGENLIALQVSDSNAGGSQKFAAADEGGEADKMAARIEQANARMEAETNTTQVEGVKAVDAPAATHMSDISSIILRDAEMIQDIETQQIERNETLMSAITDAKEKDESDKHKQERNDGIASVAA